MKKKYISPTLTFESIEEDSGILIDGSHTELKDYSGGKTDGTNSEDPVTIYDDILNPPSYDDDGDE